MVEIFNKRDSEYKNQQEIVHNKIEADHENDDIESNIRVLPNYIQLMRETFGSLMRSRKSLGKEQDDLGRATIFGVPIQVTSSNSLKTTDNHNNLTDEIHKALSSTGYSGKSMTKIVIFFCQIILNMI